MEKTVAHVLVRLAGDARTLAARAAYEAAIALVATRSGQSATAIRRVYNRPVHLADLRRRALYLTVTHFGVSCRQAARASGLSIEAVAKACRAVEEAREDPVLDRLLDELQLELMP